MKAKIEFLKDTSADFIGTQLPLEAGTWLYAECASSQVVALPHALNPEAFRPLVPHRDRPIDIGARSQQYWSCLGDNQRNELFGLFATHAFNPPLAIDIDTKTRYDRAGWAEFLNRCRGTISNEAGSYYLERDDATVAKIQAFVEEQQKASGAGMVRLKRIVKAPLGRILKTMNIRYYSDIYGQLDFPETYERFFKHTGRCPFYSKAISSRHFDAIGTKTCQVMPRGRFNDILVADQHYICLEHDFSNIDDAMKRFMDDGFRQAMVDRAYEYAMDRHTYRHRVDAVRDLVQHDRSSMPAHHTPLP
jgi:spore maturation protein CgeB